MNDETRAWSKRFFEQTKRMPTQLQAANYSAAMHYLKAVKAAGTDETVAVMKKNARDTDQRLLRQEWPHP
jgi:branched-chain amino acid transport system substrate-binding protein